MEEVEQTEGEEYQDIELTCFCGAKFVWEVGEQKFMDDLFAKGKIEAVTQPKRCRDCRLKKKNQRVLTKLHTEGY